RWTVPGEGHLSVRRIVVRKGDDALVLDPNRPPDGYVDGAWLDGGDTWLGWAFRDLAGRAEEVRTLVHLFPDRPVYRPGDEVQLKGYVRSRFQGHLTPARGTGAIVVIGPGDAEWRLPVELSGGGSIHAVWQEDEPPTGAYVALFEDERGVRFGETSFRVEAYRLPTFEVSLTGPQNVTTVANDRAFDVGLVATYYAGGRVAARPVRWRVTQFPFAWTPASTTASPSLAGFAWSSDDRYSRGGGFRATPELAIDATTAANGESSLSLDPGIEADARPRTYLVEATVTGADDLTVTSTLRVDAVPAFVLGLKAPRYLPDAKAIPVEVVAVGPDGAVVPGLDTTVRLIRREWHSVLEAGDFTTGQAKYLTDVVDVPVRDTPVETGARAVSTSLPIDRPGVYLVEVEARDALDRVQVVRIDLYAGGEGAVGWEKPKAGTFDLSLDAKSYRPGKQANIVVRSPFQQGSALAVIEAPDGNRYRQVEVRGGQATLQIPIETGWVPRIPVHVVLRRGRTADPPADGFDTGKPQTVASTVWLPIDPVENQVTVTVSNPERALPGQTVPVTVKLADPDGKPLAGELTLWLVDQAVLALGREQRLDPVPDFVDGRESRMTVHDTRNQVLGQLPVDPMPGGDGELEEESVLDKATVRKDFRPLAYYAPSLKVPASGTLTVDVALPDNLTVFKIRAKAMSGAERFGVGTGQIAVRLPVVVQPALPRFVRPGDRFEAAGLVRVIEGDGGPGRVELAAAGLTVEGDAARAVPLDPALANRVAWPVTVTTPPIGEDGTLAYRTVKLTIGAKRSSDGASDAAETVLPLRDDRRVRYDRQLVDLASKGTATIPALTEPARPGSVHRSVVVGSHQGLLRMAAAVDVSRTGEPHGTDAILSRGRIVVGLGALRGPLGLEDDAEIRGIVDETVAWLPVVLDDRGLVAQYPGAAGRVWLTADALAFLADAKAQGYPVDGRITAALEGALTAALRSDYAYFLDGESWSERTAALYGLAVDGKFDAGYFAELARNTRFLVPEAQARTLLAATRGGQGASPAAVELAGKVSNEVVTELYQGKERYAGLKSRRTDRTPFVAPSEAREVATILRALLAATPSEPKLDELVDALVRLGKTDGWGQPNADAAATIALAEAQRTLAGPATTVSVADGARTTPLTLTATATLARATTASAGALTLTDSGAGPATALVVSRWIPAADGSAQAPEQSGFVVEREWLVVSASGPADRRPIAAAGTKLAVSVGQVLEEHVRIVNPVDRTDVIVVVPLAAGVEPLNPALATAGPDATPANRSTGNPTWTSFGDDRALYAFERLPKGTYDLYFRTKAAVAGTFVQPAASAEMVYDRRAIGLSAGAKVEITGGS
ncbi:MAG: alpha-2-macroglobulin family protein, partial [Myxococcota bacterium]